MANKRMFSKQITTSDAFVDMPTSSQLLYFHLNMEADDDGFVANPKRISKMVGSNDDDLKILLAKRFLLAFDSGVMVIKHWLLHNTIRKDMYQETQYIEEKKQLQIKDNKVYTEVRNESVTEPLHRLDKIRLEQIRLDKVRPDSEETSQVVELIDTFKEINPSYKKFFSNKSQRSACKRLLETHGLEKLKKIISFLPQSNNTQYMPVVTTPVQLEDKFAQLATAWQKIKSNQKIIL